TQSHLIESDGLMFVVQRTGVDYHAPSRLDDELNLTVVVEYLGRAAVDFMQQAWRNENGAPKLLATGRITVVCVNAKTFKPQAIPQHVLKLIR
ncbi:MAG: 4-hydroxybenzoyl-CoA thioesterase, partial [Glaciimonas sp.]|nr:4-hydroxybenzoyl-CoA thioesterase [Glaciimonas sp.]